MGHWYFTDNLPEAKAYKMAQQDQERLNNMVRAGDVLEVGKKELILQVIKKGNDIVNGEVLKVNFTDYTTIQEGMSFVKKPGEELDLTEYIKPGMAVTMLVENGEALALHFDGNTD